MADADRPVYAAVTACGAKVDAAGCSIVTRFKSNTPLTVTPEFQVPEGGAILSDRIGLLPRRQAKSRKSPFSDPVREVRVRIETGKILRILCNDLDASAQEIADLYKRRWPIELFFRWVKQTLKIRHFLGTRPVGPCEPHAPAAHRPADRGRPQTSDRLQSAGAAMDVILNRTAVGQARP